MERFFWGVCVHHACMHILFEQTAVLWMNWLGKKTGLYNTIADNPPVEMGVKEEARSSTQPSAMLLFGCIYYCSISSACLQSFDDIVHM